MKNLILVFALLAFVGCSASKRIKKGPPLENINWILANYGGKDYAPPADGKPVTLTLQTEGNRIVGFGGCNSFSGSYVLEEGVIQFTLISTKMFCNETMEVEDYLFKTLTKVEYSIEGDTLTLKNENGNVVQFKKS